MSLIEQLVEALRCLPGVGPKSAQRIAMHLLERDRQGGESLARVLLEAIERVGHCESCRNFTEDKLCAICRSERRDEALLCVVESPMDVVSVEQSGAYRGRYYVLMGRLSPIDGIGPDELGLSVLEQRFLAGGIREVILATGTTLEGEATAHYIAEMAAESGIRSTRIAYGVPLGGELEYVDGSTLSHAISSRRDYGTAPDREPS